MARHSFRSARALAACAGVIFGLGCLGIAFAATPAVPTASATKSEPLHVQIDQLIAAKFPKYTAFQAPLTTDAEFLRRVTLDLTGNVPSVNATRQFLADRDPQKRSRLIDSLLGSADHARHFANVFDVIYMRRIKTDNIPSKDWKDYLQQSFAENKPYDQLAREILSADGSDPKTHCRARFYVDRQGEMNEITRDVGRIFLGADLECAQCHDHPQIDDFRQEHYYGLAAFFVRASLYRNKDRQFMIAEKADGEVSFESVFDIRDKVSHGPQTTKPKLFDRPAIVEPAFAKTDDRYLVKPGKDVRAVPKFSRLGGIARVITAPENTRFARTAANRLWAVLMGRGIVDPVDLDHSFNPPSHPELLDVLTQSLARNKYNTRDFIREIALSQTYQRSSQRLKSDGSPAENAPPEMFAQAPLKPLSPEQFARALLQATGTGEVPQDAAGDQVDKSAATKSKKPKEDFAKRIVSLFGGVPGKPSSQFEATPVQALYLANDPQLIALTAPKPGNLAERLQKFAPADVAPLAEELYLSLLSRPPVPQEVQDVREYLADAKPAERPDLLRQLIWALATSAEFRFNH